jgi:hypothetical protein
VTWIAGTYIPALARTWLTWVGAVVTAGGLAARLVFGVALPAEMWMLVFVVGLIGAQVRVAYRLNRPAPLEAPVGSTTIVHGDVHNYYTQAGPPALAAPVPPPAALGPDPAPPVEQHEAPHPEDQ